MARKPDDNELFKQVASRKIEAERVRVRKLEVENEHLRAVTSDLQKKISLANSKASELERRLKTALASKDKSANKDRDALERELKRLHREELSDLKAQHRDALEEQKAKLEKRLVDQKARLEKQINRDQTKGARAIEKLEDQHSNASAQIEDLQDQLASEREARTEAEARLKRLSTSARRLANRAGQWMGLEPDSPEDVFDALSNIDPGAPLKVLRGAIRALRSAASGVERAFARAVKSDDARGELADAGEALRDALELPDTQDVPPATAQLIEEAFSMVAEEVRERIKGRHYQALITAMASELVRVLRNDRKQLEALQRVVEIAEGTDLATGARLLLKGATSHQQEMEAARLVANELAQVKADAREHRGKVKKLYAVAEQGMAGEWAVDAIQAMASLQPMPRPDKQAYSRAMYKRVVDAGRLLQQRIDASMNLGAEAEAALREADESFAGLEGLASSLGELSQSARRQVMHKDESESDQRLRIDAERESLRNLGKRGGRADAIFDEYVRVFDGLLTQWKATYTSYASLNRDMDRIVASIEGHTLDIEQPLETDDGKRLFAIVHDLSEHLPEFRSLSVMKQRLFFHLENARQRLVEVKHVRETAGKVKRALEAASDDSVTTTYQFTMARLYDIWAYLEEVRDGSHSQLAVCSETIEPDIADVMVWASSHQLASLTDSEQSDLLLTLAYVRRLKRQVLGIHDRSQDTLNAGVGTAAFEQRLEAMTFPDDWAIVERRLQTVVEEDDDPPTDIEF